MPILHQPNTTIINTIRSSVQSSRLSNPIGGSPALMRGKPMNIGVTFSTYQGQAVLGDKLYVKYNTNKYLIYDIPTKTFTNQTITSLTSSRILVGATNDGRLVEANFTINSESGQSRVVAYIRDINTWVATSKSYPICSFAKSTRNGVVVINPETNTMYLIQSSSMSSNAPCKVWYRDVDDTTSDWIEFINTTSIYTYSNGLNIEEAVYSAETNSIYYTCASNSSSSTEVRFVRVDLNGEGSYTILGTISGVSNSPRSKLIVYEDKLENGNYNIYITANSASAEVLCCFYEIGKTLGEATTTTRKITRDGGGMLFFQLDKYNCLTLMTSKPTYMMECFTAMIVMLPVLTSANTNLYGTAMFKDEYLLDYFSNITNNSYSILCVNQETGEMSFLNPKIIHDIYNHTTSAIYSCSGCAVYQATGFTLVFSQYTGLFIV